MLRGFVGKMKLGRYGYGERGSGEAMGDRDREKGRSVGKIRNFFYHAMQSRIQEDRRYFSLDK